MVTYPSDWEEKRIGELFSVSAGGDVKKQYFSKFRTSQSPYEIYSNGIDNRGLYGYTSDAFYPGNSLTVTARGTIGKAYYREKTFDAIIRLLVLSPKCSDVKPKFYEYFINSQVEFEKENTGVPQLTAPKIKEKVVPFLKGDEQEQIIETLQSFDTYVDDLAELIEKKRGIRDGALMDLVSGKTRLEKFNDEWSEASLGSIGIFIKGAPLSKADITTSGNLLILYGELYTTYHEVTYKAYRHTDGTVDEKHLSRVGDVIIPSSGETAEEIATATCVMIPGVVLAGDLNIYRTKELDGRFLSHVINHIVNQKISEKAQGISIIHINAKELAKITVCYPSVPEQTAIADIIDAMDEEIAALEIERDKMIQIREGAMDDLLTGRVRLSM